MKDELREMNLEPESYTGGLREMTFQSDAAMVRIDIERGILDIYKNGHAIYYIDLEYRTTSAQVLDWLAQISQKRWASPTLIGLVAIALDKALGLQSNLCGGGQSGEIPGSSIRRLVRGNLRKAPGWSSCDPNRNIVMSAC